VRNASVLTLTLVSVIPGQRSRNPESREPSPPDSGFAPSGAPRNDGGKKRQQHNTSIWWWLASGRVRRLEVGEGQTWEPAS
jgi:hypothetical protein